MLADAPSKIAIPSFALTHSPTPSEPAKCGGTLTQLPAVCSFLLNLPEEGKVVGGDGGRVEPASRSHQAQPFVTPCAVERSSKGSFYLYHVVLLCFLTSHCHARKTISSQRVKCAKNHAWFLPYFSTLPHLALCWLFLMTLC